MVSRKCLPPITVVAAAAVIGHESNSATISTVGKKTSVCKLLAFEAWVFGMERSHVFGRPAPAGSPTQRFSS